MREISGAVVHPLLLGVGVALCLGVVICCVATWRLLRAVARLRALLTGTEGEGLEELAARCLGGVKEVGARCEGLAERCDVLADGLGGCLQHVGLVRFNAFDNTGSDLSFALALLDARGDGAVLTSIYGREESRTYAKPVRQGESEYALSAEERLAIGRAWRPAGDGGQKLRRAGGSGRKSKKGVEGNTRDG